MLHTISGGNVPGLLISLVCLLLLGIISFLYTEERMLNEGAKELIGMLNKEGFFLLDRERILMPATQIFAYLGMKLGLPLNSILYLYSMNTFLVTLAIFLVCIRMGDYHAGIYLCAFQVVGISHSFFLYPFLELVYALLFSYLLYRTLDLYSPDSRWVILPVILMVLLVTTIYPVSILLVALVLIRSRLTGKWKAGLLLFSAVCLAASLLYTEIPAGAKLATLDPFDHTGRRLVLLAEKYPDLLLLYAAGLYAAWRSERRCLLLALAVLSGIPFLFNYQVGIYQFVLPSGMSLMLFATHPRWCKNAIVLVFIISLLAFNLYRLHHVKWLYGESGAVVERLIQSARQAGGTKFILVGDPDGGISGDLPLKYPLEESIRHSSLLMSSVGGPTGSVIIESLSFNQDHFMPDTATFEEPGEIIRFMGGLYEDTTTRSLYPNYAAQYEYCKYLFTYKSVNKRYFGISDRDEYRLLED